MLRPGNVATPATAATVLVPDKVPVLGLVPIATVMFPVNPLAVLPLASWAVTWTAGVIAAPATVLVGWTLKRSEEHTSELQSQSNLVCRLLLEKKKHIWRPTVDTVIGHSYGSTMVCSAASGRHHVDANNIIAVGIHSMLVDDSSYLRI